MNISRSRRRSIVLLQDDYDDGTTTVQECFNFPDGCVIQGYCVNREERRSDSSTENYPGVNVVRLKGGFKAKLAGTRSAEARERRASLQRKLDQLGVLAS